MAVSKRKCKQCGEYREAETGVKVPSGWFCSHDHAVAFAMDSAKKMQKEGSLTEDDLKSGETQIQKLTDKYVAEVDSQVASKEADIMKI